MFQQCLDFSNQLPPPETLEFCSKMLVPIARPFLALVCLTTVSGKSYLRHQFHNATWQFLSSNCPQNCGFLLPRLKFSIPAMLLYIFKDFSYRKKILMQMQSVHQLGCQKVLTLG